MHSAVSIILLMRSAIVSASSGARPLHLVFGLRLRRTAGDFTGDFKQGHMTFVSGSFEPAA